MKFGNTLQTNLGAKMSGGRPKIPVWIRGVRYESLSEAGAVLGVTAAAVHLAMKKGTLNRVGLAVPARLARGEITREEAYPRPQQRKAEPIEIRGKKYASAKEAAEELGVTTATIYSAKSAGRLDFVGLGSGCHMRKK